MKNLIAVLGLILFVSCKDDVPPVVVPPVVSEPFFLKAADLSSLSMIEASGTAFKDSAGQAEDVLSTLKSNGCNAVRLRLWKNPVTEYSGTEDVAGIAQRVKSKGLKVWLSVHYSDSWADPGQQNTPAAWANLSLDLLKDSIYNYTRDVVMQIQPDYIQIGNEINGGFLWPKGKISSPEQFSALLSSGIQAVRDHAPNTKIIIHFAGLTNTAWFFDQLTGLDYDIIGLSYYPFWHGKDMAVLENTLSDLAATHDKDVLIAETAYPFTLGWNDWTNNVLGLDSQLILPDFPATEAGQQAFLDKIVETSRGINRGIGFCYWGAELVAFDGSQSPNGSTWENQALYDFTNKALPAMKSFRK